MKLRFESWMGNQNYSSEAVTLFTESIVCYKMGAYRAAIIMSYLGMQTVIRTRVLSFSSTPQKIESGSWEKRQRNIKNDVEWDKEVFDLVNMGIDKNPFIITDDTRKQYDYWRTIRNTCAHAKSDLISASHVESLWLFIESSLNKFIVNGGKDYILNELLKHLNTNYTMPDKPVAPLIDSVLEYIHSSELVDLYEDLFEKIHEEDFQSGEVLQNGKSEYKLWKEINDYSRPVLKSAFYEFIRKDSKYIKYFINAFPDILDVIKEDPTVIRNIWKERYWEWNIPWYIDEWEFFIYLLKHEYIKDEEKDEFLEILRKKLGKFPPDNYVDFLKPMGFFDKVERNIFNDSHFGMNSFQYCNSKIYEFLRIIRITGFNENNVKLLNRELRIMRYGEFYDGMKDFLLNNREFKDQYIDIVNSIGAELPDFMSEENDE
jgi:hypothetical protein